MVGGPTENDRSLDTFERYDPATNNWESLPPIPLGAASIGLVAIDGRLVSVGGDDQSHWEEGGGWVTPSAWSFNPKKNRWTRLPNMHFERRGSGVAATEGRIYALGGSYCPGLKPNGPIGTHTVESLPISAVIRAERAAAVELRLREPAERCLWIGAALRPATGLKTSIWTFPG